MTFQTTPTALRPPTEPISFRPYQEEALQAVERALSRGTTRVVIALPCGTGKSTITAQLPKRLGTPLLLLAHREELLDQHAKQMYRANPGIRVAIEQAHRRAKGTEDVILASIPTLATREGRRLARLATIPWRAVIVDEVHHAPAKTWSSTITTLGCLETGGPPLCGTTATPRRGDGIGLQELFQEIVYQRSLREMIDDGWCCNMRAYAIHTDVELDHVKIRHGDFAEGSLAKTVNTPARNTLLVEAWRRLANDRRTLVFCTDILHAEAVAISFQRAGIHAQPFTQKLPKDLRRTRLAAFKDGTIPVLTSVTILSESYDDPPLSCLLLARPTKSPLLFEQMIGRGTRISPDKPDCLVLDVVDVSLTHKLQTVASLFGLPPNLNLNGRSVTKTADEIEAALSRNPTLQPELFATADQLLAEASRLTLNIRSIDLVPTLAPEVQSEATLAWIRLPSTEYVLPLAGREQIRVRSNLLDQWEVVSFPTRAILHTDPNRPGAFAAAETEIATRDPERWKLAHHQAAWRQRLPTDRQRDVLTKVGLVTPATRGEASQLIDQLRAKHQEPATPKQRWFLKQHDAWQDGMTRGEAGRTIKAIKDGTYTQPSPDAPTPTSPGASTPMAANTPSSTTPAPDAS